MTISNNFLSVFLLFFLCSIINSATTIAYPVPDGQLGPVDPSSSTGDEVTTLG
ncbi:8531_t:CDS:1, partial [Ambispora gerdemannii]